MYPVGVASLCDDLEIKGLRRDLLHWFVHHKRDLPWRSKKSLYGTWVAEIMLQQTTVAAVIPYYRRFLERFPDVQALAEADLHEVLELWSGLGYYRRARMLHAAAGLIVAQRDGDLPRSRAQWLEIPGVGAYAAGSIASIGLGERVPALDANAKRVLVRWACATPACAEEMKGARLSGLAAHAVDPAAPGSWNEAVMELGALVCRAVDPLCGYCPVRRWCRAGSAGTAGQVPPRVKPATVLPAVLAQLVVALENRVFLTPPGTLPVALAVSGDRILRDDFSGLHRGLWGLPTSPWLVSEADIPEDPRTLWGGLVEISTRRKGKAVFRHMGEVRHAITRYRLRVQVHLVQFSDPKDLPAALRFPTRVAAAGSQAVGAFFPLPLEGVPVSALTVKVLAKAGSSGG